MSTTLTQSNLRVLIEQLRIQHDQGADMTGVYKAIDALRAKDDEEQRLARTLQGVAEQAMLSVPPKIFIVAYRQDEETKTVYGFERKDGIVFMEPGHSWPIQGFTLTSMEGFKQRLESQGIPYYVAYVEPSKKAERAQ